MTDDTATSAAHVRSVNIPSDAIRQWLQIATLVFDASPVFKLEVLQLFADPTVHRLGRAAKAARFVAHSVRPPLSQLAARAAVEMEDVAAG